MTRALHGGVDHHARAARILDEEPLDAHMGAVGQLESFAVGADLGEFVFCNRTDDDGLLARSRDGAELRGPMHAFEQDDLIARDQLRAKRGPIVARLDFVGLSVRCVDNAGHGA